MQVRKRNGSLEDFNSSKAKRALKQAMKAGSGQYFPHLINAIVSELEEYVAKQEDPVEYKKVDKFILGRLRDYGQEATAAAYERFKTLKHYKESESRIDNEIEGLVNGTNTGVIDENSNKDAKLISTQRDLIAGIESRDYAERKIMPLHILQAHQDGIIHVHDTDYMIHKGIFNCFGNEVKLVTNEGVKAFKDFYDGDNVKVKDKDGVWRDATIRKYGRQKLFNITMHSGRNKQTIRATRNHRWILKDGTVTTDLQVGDRLYTLKNSSIYEPITKYEKRMFALGFVVGDGTDMYKNGERDYGVHVRLCGEKSKLVSLFSEAGYDIAQFTKSEDLIAYNKKEIAKQCFLNSRGWRLLDTNAKIALFNGYLAADGAKNANSVSTTDERICLMIEEISGVAGYFIASKSIRVHDTNYKKNAQIIEYRFRVSQNDNNPWIIDSIEPVKSKSGNYNDYEVWCVEEPITHTFTLANGIVTGNCQLISLKDMLMNGTCINGKKIEIPKSLQTAATVATQISLQVANGQYGGQTFSLAHLAPFVRVSYEKYKKELTESYKLLGKEIDEEYVDMVAKHLTRKEAKSAVQTIQFQENTFSSSNGQTPFVSVFMWINEEPEYVEETVLLIEEMLNLRYKGMLNQDGVWVTPAFPKLLYVLDEDNVPKGSKYRWLTDLAVKCAAKRMNPDFISAKIMRENYEGNVFPCMGCRSMLAPWKDENGEYKFYGRFNRGVVTLNLVDVALSARKNFDEFWKILDERLEICKDALKMRTKLQYGAPSDVSPIHWQHGSVARLKSGEKIDKYLENGYSSISLGYIGLYEMCMAMIGKSNTTEEGRKFALDVLQHMLDKCNEWKKEKYLNGCSLYGTPSESLCYKFARKTEKRFGTIKGITDKDWFTNSYHVCVTEPIDAFEKLKFESEFQKISKGGAVSYVEVPNMQDNLEALAQIVDYMYETILYAEINTRSGDVCGNCGFEGEITTDENGVWTCPQCGCQDRDKMTVVRRTCGYIGSNYWNKGKTEEITNRVYHI